MQPVGERAPNHRNAVTFHTDHLSLTKGICTADWARFSKLFVCDRGAWPLSTSVQRKWPGSVFKCLNRPPVTSLVRLKTTSLVTHVSARVNFADWRVIHHISNQCSSIQFWSSTKIVYFTFALDWLDMCIYAWNSHEDAAWGTAGEYLTFEDIVKLSHESLYIFLQKIVSDKSVYSKWINYNIFRELCTWSALCCGLVQGY